MGFDNIPIPFNHEVPLITRNLKTTEIVALSGALSGFLAGVVVCPLDVAKTRLQAQDSKSSLNSNNALNKGLGQTSYIKKYNGLLGTLKTIVKEENIRGLYKGLVPITLGYFPTWMIYFSVYEYCKKSPIYKQNLQKDYQLHSLSAMTAGFISTISTNPIWVVKTRLMLQTENIEKNLVEVKPLYMGSQTKLNSSSLQQQQQQQQQLQQQNSSISRYNGTIDCFKKMYRYEGWRSFYKGLLPSFFGLFHVAIHFPLYEQCKVLLNVHTSASTKNMNSHDGNSVAKGSAKENLVKLLLASCVSKMCASSITYPHEILRTRMQIKDSKGMLATIRKIYTTNGGLKGFYQGFLTNLIRTVPASAITLVSFEYFKNFITKHNTHLML